jgi:hypothetical protein
VITDASAETFEDSLFEFPEFEYVALLLFAIKMATLPFWAEIKNLRSRSRKAHKFFNDSSDLTSCKIFLAARGVGRLRGLPAPLFLL